MKNITLFCAKTALELGLLTTLTCLSFTGHASAQTLMQGATSVSTDMGELTVYNRYRELMPSTNPISNIINQSGLYTTYSNGQDQAAYLGGNPLHTPTTITEWVAFLKTTGNIDFDLGAAFNLENIVLWNEEVSGIKDFDLFASNVADFSTVTPLGSFTAPDTPWYQPYPASVFSFTQTNARYVRMTVKNVYPVITFGGNTASLGEVAFGIASQQEPPASVPEPGSATVMVGLGSLGLGMGVKKKLAQK